MSNSDGARSQRRQEMVWAPFPGSELSWNFPVDVSYEVSSQREYR